MNVEELTKKVVGDGGVLAYLYFDIHGSREDLIQGMGASLIKKVVDYPGVVYAVGRIEKPIFQDGLYSTAVEVKVLAKSFSALASACSYFCPFSVEIVSPEKITLDISEMHDILMNISSTVFEYKNHIVRKMSTKEELERYKKQMENKAILGRKLIEKGKNDD